MNNITIADNSPLVIGIVGFKESGKSFLSTHLCDNYNFKRMFFAHGIKKVAKDVFNLVMEKNGEKHDFNSFDSFHSKISDKMWYHTKLNDIFKLLNLNITADKIEQYKLKELQSILKSYYISETVDTANEYARKFWQYFGTEITQPFNQNVWVDYLDKLITTSINKLEYRIVIDDVRFKHEFEYFKILNKKSKIRTLLIGIYNNKSKIKEKTQGYKNHASEIHIPELLEKCEIKIYNEYTSKFLYDMDDIIEKILIKRSI